MLKLQRQKKHHRILYHIIAGHHRCRKHSISCCCFERLFLASVNDSIPQLLRELIGSFSEVRNISEMPTTFSLLCVDVTVSLCFHVLFLSCCQENTLELLPNNSLLPSLTYVFPHGLSMCCRFQSCLSDENIPMYRGSLHVFFKTKTTSISSFYEVNGFTICAHMSENAEVIITRA